MKITPQTVWQDLQAIRATAPLIHNITNYVVMNNTANALLALGATPVMAHAINEVEDMMKIAAVLAINIGTLSRNWVESMQLAVWAARQLNKPMILDPVGAGATAYRTEVTRKLLSLSPPAVIRGNASEILAIGTEFSSTKGVDSTRPAEAALEGAKMISATYHCTVVVSGAKDFIVNQQQVIQCDNGHPLMAKVTGMGCTATALVAAFLAVNSEVMMAAAHGMAVMGITGEIAAERAAGPGSLQLHFLDVLYHLSFAEIESRLKLTNFAE